MPKHSRMTRVSRVTGMRSTENPFQVWWTGFTLMAVKSANIRPCGLEPTAMLSWFEDKVDETGLVGPLPWWPFALSLSFNAPHAHDESEQQYFWQDEVAHLFESMTMPEPALGGDEYFERLPEAVRNGFNRERWYWRYDTPEKYQHSVKGYYRMYDRSIRVPLIIYDPRVKQHRDIDDMALNIDVTATIVDLAGIDVPAGYHGKSLVPIITGDEKTLSRDTVLIEHLWDFPDIPPSEGVRTDEWKYMRYVDDPSIEELYNLREDPQETNNLAFNPDHEETLAKLRVKLILLAERYDSAPGE